jgi:hypothetical protein
MPEGPKEHSSSLGLSDFAGGSYASRVDASPPNFYLSGLMRLYAGKVGPIASDIVRLLLDAGDIEAGRPKEVQADIEAVLHQYIRTDKEAADKARDAVQSRGLPQTEVGRMRKLTAEQMGIKIGDESIDYLLDQILEILMHSANVDEIFAADVELRRKMAPVLKKHMAVDEESEREARTKLKHLKEGTPTWEIEYTRVMDDIKRRKGL